MYTVDDFHHPPWPSWELDTCDNYILTQRRHGGTTLKLNITSGMPGRLVEIDRRLIDYYKYGNAGLLIVATLRNAA